MARHAFNKSTRGQIKSLPNFPSESDANLWQNVCPIWPQSPQSFNRQAATVLKASRDLPDSTALSGYASLTITHLWAWISLGYHMDPVTGSFREQEIKNIGGQDVVFTGTCIDALDAFNPLVRVARDSGGGWVAETGYTDLYPSAGLAVHAMVRQDQVLAFATNGGVNPLPSEFGIPITTQLFFQASEQPVPMTYHRNNWRNLIPEGTQIVVPAGDKLQIEMKNSAGLTEHSMFEFDVIVQGYLED